MDQLLYTAISYHVSPGGCMTTKTLKSHESSFSATSQRYELIENETLTNCTYRDLTFSGSLLKSCHFENVTFIKCTFFGCKLQNVSFKNCSFLDCKFQFTQIENGQFCAHKFHSTQFESSPADQCSLFLCQLDIKSIHQFSQNDSNSMVQCFAEESAPILTA